ncbi:MAG: hypothetical protein DYG90_14210, partial [Chloroflexi bacterium CFX6]|nr:hypothetical protein [Chloroflexi bacterium CFX6]
MSKSAVFAVLLAALGAGWSVGAIVARPLPNPLGQAAPTSTGYPPTTFKLALNRCEALICLTVDPWLQELYLVNVRGDRVDLIPNVNAPPVVDQPLYMGIHDCVSVRFSVIHRPPGNTTDIVVRVHDNIVPRVYTVAWPNNYRYQPGDPVQIGIAYSYDRAGARTTRVVRSIPSLPPCGVPGTVSPTASPTPSAT